MCAGGECESGKKRGKTPLFRPALACLVNFEVRLHAGEHLHKGFVFGGRETIECGAAQTDFLKFGDSVRIEMFDAQGKSIFGAIEQMVARYPEHG